MRFLKYTLALVAISSAMASEAAIREFSYPELGQKVLYFGNNKAESYDLAIRIADPSLEGKKITGLKVALRPGATVSETKGWISSELKLSSKVNDPDIASVDASVSEDNILTAVFSEPYTLTDQGIYVGYSFKIAKILEDVDRYPIPVAACNNENGFFIHSSRTYLKWDNESDLGYASTMEVTLEGDFPDYAVSLNTVGNVRCAYDEEMMEIPVSLSNFSAEDVSSLGYNLTFEGSEPYSGTISLESPVPAKFGSSASLLFYAPRPAQSGNFSVSITSVNGHDNYFASRQLTAECNLLEFVPVMRPLMEEYTGLWCGWCPRGLVAMEEMSELYPDDFVCVSYHDGDKMQYISDFPNAVSGYPGAFMNRLFETDPYYGNKSNGFGIRDLWLNLRTNEAVANINVNVGWDEEANILKCASDVRFADSGNGDDYRVNFILVGDGFTSIEGEVLSQNNSYKGAEPLDDFPLWNEIVTGGSTLRNLTFNDVAIRCSEPVAGFPAKLHANETYSVSYEFDLNAIQEEITSQKLVAIQHFDKLHVVAVLLSSDGKFLNCNRSVDSGEAGIKMVGSDVEVVGSEWYDLTGRCVLTPSNGIFIRIDRLSDGSVRSSKSIVR